jgi:pimeloyl-ACP methyl ester carboxylesterase
VYAIDARNHGNSDHVPQLDYHLMSRDTVEFCEQHKLEKVSLIGNKALGYSMATMYIPYG